MRQAAESLKIPLPPGRLEPPKVESPKAVEEKDEAAPSGEKPGADGSAPDAQAGGLDMTDPTVRAKLQAAAKGVLAEAENNPSVKTPEGFTKRFFQMFKKAGKEDKLTGRILNTLWVEASNMDDTLPDASRGEFDQYLEDLRNPKEKTYRWITPEMEAQGWSEKYDNKGLFPRWYLTTPAGGVLLAIENKDASASQSPAAHVCG